MPTLGEFVPYVLAERGVSVAFGIPGAHNLEFYRSLPNSGLRHFSARHEQGAGFMADGFARATGRAAACFATSGPGVTNLATPMAQALNCSVPMLVISSDNPGDSIGAGRGLLHEMRDQSAFIAEVSRASRTVETPDALVAAVDEALTLFTRARPGPFHIRIPTDALQTQIGEFVIGQRAAKGPAQPNRDALAEAVRRLAAAERPALILGGGAVGVGSAIVLELAQTLACPVFLTSNARGLMPRGHPQLFGGLLHTRAARKLLAEADAVLAIGTELSPTDWDFFTGGPLEFAEGALIRVDIDPAQLAANAEPALALHGDAKAVMDSLLLGVAPRKTQIADLSPARSAALAELDRRFSRHLPLVRAIWEVLPEAILVGDSTEPSYAGMVAAEPPAPRKWWTGASGFGSLGYAIPAALGASIGAKKPVVALVGDGGALFTIAELAAAKEANLPVSVLVWNNSGYNEIREYMRSARIPPQSVDLSTVDFQAIARGFGVQYQRVHDLPTLRETLRSSSARSHATIIEMREEYWF